MPSTVAAQTAERSNGLLQAGWAGLAVGITIMVMILIGAFLWNRSLRQQVLAHTAALRESDERFRDFANASSDWFWEQDANLRFTSITGEVFTDTNTAVDNNIGKTRRDIVSIGVSEEQWRQHDADLAAHRPFRDFSFQRHDADGKLWSFSVSGNPVFDADGVFKGYRGVGRNITESNQAEEALRKSEERLRGMAATIPGVIYRRSHAPDGSWRYDFVSEGYADIIGRPLDEIVANPDIVKDIIHPEDYGSLVHSIKESVETLGSTVIEYRAIMPDGTTKWLRSTSQARRLDNGHVVSDGVTLDITEQKRAEDALRDSEERLQNIAASIPGGVYRRIHKPDGTWRYDFISAGYGEMVERDIDDILANPSVIAEVVHQEDRERLIDVINHSVETLERTSVEYRVVTPDGAIKWLQAISQARRLANGDVVCDGVSLDITERKHAEEQLRQAQKMEAIGQLTAGVAHDFNNLLAVIVGNTELIEDNLGDNESDQRHIDAVIQAVDRASSLTDRLLAYPRQ
jgi:PAS domain S-box-containing protein